MPVARFYRTVICCFRLIHCYSNATGRKCSIFKAETPALQNAVAYIAEMKPQKTIILTDSKATLQSLTSNTPDQPIHQLLKDLQLIPHECTVVLQWIPAHCGIPGNEGADRLAKSESKQPHPCLPPLTRKPKPCSEIAKTVNGKEPLETTTPLLIQSTVWQDMNRPLYSDCEQDTVVCEHTGSELASWTLHSAIAKKRNRRSTTSSRTVPSGGNRDTSYGRRMSQPPTSYGERRKTSSASPNSWQHVD